MLIKRTERIWIFVYLLISFAGRCGPEKNCAGAGRVRVQLVRGGAGADTEYKFMCGFSQARGPAGRLRAWFKGPRRHLISAFKFYKALVWYSCHYVCSIYIYQHKYKSNHPNMMNWFYNEFIGAVYFNPLNKWFHQARFCANLLSLLGTFTWPI